MTIKSTDVGVSQRTNVWAGREMLKWAAPTVVLDRFGDTKRMPKNKGVNPKFRRPKTFTAATTPLQEGVTPTAHAFQYEDVSAVLKQYGDLVEVTDVIEDTHEDPVIQDCSRQSGENIGRTTEALMYGVLKAGTNVSYAAGVASRSLVASVISIGGLRNIARALEKQKAMKITKVMDGSQNYGTFPIQASWIVVCHTDIEADIRQLPGFVPVADYGSRRLVHDREFGACENFRFVTSADLAPIADAGAAAGATLLSTGGTNADVYPILVFGANAYGTVAMRGQGAVQPTILRPGVPDKSDPLGQRGYVGWKTWWCGLILNEAWMMRHEVAASVVS